MRVHVLSDLHLEGATFEPVPVEADVTVLAGDITTTRSDHDFVKIVRQYTKDRPVLYIAGNHEFYKCAYDTRLAKLRELCNETGAISLEHASVVIDGVTFCGSTLWTDFTVGSDSVPAAMQRARNGISDFHLIRFAGHLFDPIDAQMLYQQAQFTLDRALAEAVGKTVLVTHFMSSPHSIDPMYQGNLLNSYFCTSLLERLSVVPTLAIHGHTHSPCDYVHPRGTRVVCHPRGYGHEPSFRNYKKDYVVEI